MLDFIYRWKFTIISLAMFYSAFRIAPVIIDSMLDVKKFIAMFVVVAIVFVCELVVNSFKAIHNTEKKAE